MSWAARNSSSRVVALKPFLRTASNAVDSRSHSFCIQSPNWSDSSFNACSARATGSSRSRSATRFTAVRSGLGCVMIWWSPKVSTWSLGGAF